MTDISMIIPWRNRAGATSASTRARDLVIGHVCDEVGRVEVVLADDPNPGPFNRGRALDHGVARADGSLLLFHDADMVLPIGNLSRAFDRLHWPDQPGYVVPFTSVAYLSQVGTTGVLAGDASFALDLITYPTCGSLVDMRWERLSTGGVNVLTRDHYMRAGGFDPRFAGWGGEDAAFDLAVGTLVAPGAHIDGQAAHLWHPYATDRGTQQTEVNMLLCRRYEQAWDDPDAMRALIAEHR